MIKLKYYPVRFGKECQEHDLDYSRDMLLEDFVAQAGVDPSEMDVIVDGKVFNDLAQTIADQSEIIVTPKIEWGALVAIAHPIWAAALAHPYIAWGLILSATYSIYSAVSSMRSINTGSYGTGLDESSPTYGWDGIQTTQEVGVPVKRIGGRHRTGGNIINQFVSTDGDKQYLNILIAICEGPVVDITDILVNDNPIENYTDIEVIKRLGTNDQTVIPGFEDLHNLKTVNVQLYKDSAHVYTTEDSDVEGFELYLNAPNGIYQYDANGNLLSWDVTYRVEYKLHSEGTYVDLGTTTISAKNQSAVRRIFRKDGLTPGQYDIRVTRTSDDSSATSPQKMGDLYLASFDEIKTDDLSYPNTVLVGIKALATDQLSGSTPNFTFIIEDSAVSFPAVLTAEGGDPVNWEDYYWDPVAEVFKLFADDSVLYWDGVTYTTGFCANPIWFCKDLLLNARYGTGEFLASTDIDEDELLQEALYCEEKIPDGEGGYEKRFRMDVVIDSSTKVPDLLSQLTAAFRAFSFFSQNGFSFRIDRPAIPVQTFGMGNILRGEFQQAWKSRTEVYNVIEVQFADQDNNYEDETIAVEDEASLAAGNPRKAKKIRIFTTKKSYALREGRYALWLSKYINRTCEIGAGMDAVVCQAGDVVNVAHDVPQWGYSGRILEGSTTTLVKLDREVVIEAGKTYHLLVRFSDNTIEEVTVTDGPATYPYSEVHVSALTKAPAAFDVYSFGEINKVIKPFRVLAPKRKSNGDCKLSMIEYNASIYDDTAVVIPTNNYSSLTSGIPSVENLVLTEKNVTLGDGTIQTAIDVWFQKPSLASYYLKSYKKAKIYLSDNAGLSWQYKGETDQEHFYIFDDLVIGTEYLIAVTSVASKNEEKPIADCPQDTITLTGKITPPATVANFAYTFLDEIKLTWDKNAETDIAGYEIRDEDDDWGVNNSHRIYLGLATTHTIVRPASRTPGTLYIKAFNTSGNYSATAATVVPTNDAPATPTIAATQWFGFAKIEWDALTDDDLKRCEVYKSHTNAWAGEEFCHMVVEGRGVAALVQGNAPVDAVAASPDATSITDANLIGKGINYFVGDVLLQTSGDYSGQQAIVTGFDNDTGKVTVASWPSGTPTAGDQFVIKDRAYYKVRGVDSFGPGSFSAGVTIDFTPLTEAEIGDAIISARKLIAGEVITLSAQIKDAIITSAKILELDGGKITAETINATSLISVPAGKITGGTIEAAILILGSGGVFKSENYVKGVSGFKLDAEEGMEMNEGAVNADIVLIEGARLRDQFVVTAQSITENQDAGQWENGTKTDVTVADGKLKLSAVNTAGSFTSQILDAGAGPKFGTIQWDEIYHTILNDVARDGTPTAYKSGGGAGSNPTNANDGNDVTYADWGDGTTWWGQRAYLEIDLGSAKTITSFRALWQAHNAISFKGWNLQYSDDGGPSGTWVDATPQYYSAEITASLDVGAHRYWRLRTGVNAEYYDGWRLYTFELRITNTSNPDISVQVRTSANADMSSPTDWSDELTNPAGSNIDVEDQRYIQYKINFSTNATTKDYITVDNIKINFDIVEIANLGKVRADSGDTELDYLDGKVDGTTIQVNASDKLEVIGSKFSAGSVVFAYSDTEIATIRFDSYTKAKEIYIGASGTITVDFDMKVVTGVTAYGRIYLNGVAAGTEQSTTSTDYVTKSENISVTAGDRVQIYIKGTGDANNQYLRNFRLKCASFLGGYVQISTVGGSVVTEAP